MGDSRIISADNHVFEPADLWTTRLEPKFKDRAPRIVSMDDGDYWMFDGVKRVGVGASAQLGRRFDAPEKLSLQDRYENVARGGYIPEEHVKDNEADGIDVCIVYPTNALLMYAVPDTELLNAIFDTYNTWVAEFCNAIPNRLKGLGLINLDDVQIGIKELERCHKLGLIGANITVYPPRTSPTICRCTSHSGLRPRTGDASKSAHRLEPPWPRAGVRRPGRHQARISV